jgi:hypothetical protein
MRPLRLLLYDGFTFVLLMGYFTVVLVLLFPLQWLDRRLGSNVFPCIHRGIRAIGNL